MNNRHPGVLSLPASLLVLASLAGGCASAPSSSVDTANVQPQSLNNANEVQIDLHQHQAAVASAYLARLEELAAIDESAENPDRAVEFEVAARHLLARSSEYLSRNGAEQFKSPSPEAEAVRRADAARLRTEFACRAISLQHELVREERRTGVEGYIDNRIGGPATSDLEMLLSLSHTMITLPYSGDSGKSASGATQPPVTIGGAGNAPRATAPDQAGARANPAPDDASNRRGFATHPGYVPPQK